MRTFAYTTIALVAALSIFTSANALPPKPAPAQDEPIAIVGATLHLGNGTTIVGGTISFADGKITEVSDNASAPEGHRVIEAEGAHVYPGFILPDSNVGLDEISSLGDTVDHTERGSINPSVRSIVAYNTDSEIIPTTRFNGVLVAQPTPNGGLVAGTSSVVHFDAWNWEDAIIKADDAIHVAWPARITGQFDWSTFSFDYKPNEAFASQRAELEDLFKHAARYSGDDQTNLKLAALQGLFDGSQRLFIHSSDPRALLEGTKFARSLGIEHIVVVTTDAALLIKDFLREENIPVLLSGVHRTPAWSHHDIDAPYRLPAELTEAGLVVGLTYSSAMQARNLPFLAGTAATYGLGMDEALRLITQNNARILGIEDRLGTLEAGKDATLFISSGNALDMRSNDVQQAFIGGREITLDGMQQELYQRFSEKYAEK